MSFNFPPMKCLICKLVTYFEVHILRKNKSHSTVCMWTVRSTPNAPQVHRRHQESEPCSWLLLMFNMMYLHNKGGPSASLSLFAIQLVFRTYAVGDWKLSIVYKWHAVYGPECMLALAVREDLKNRDAFLKGLRWLQNCQIANDFHPAKL